MNNIFIVGSSRSGTTLMARVLNNSDDVKSFPELHFFEEIYSLSGKQKLNRKECIQKLVHNITSGYLVSSESNENDEIVEKILCGVDDENTSIECFNKALRYFTDDNCRFIVEQTPRNILFVDDILRALPEAKIICMIRDPRNVALSQKNKWRRRWLGAKNIPLREAVRSWFNYHPWIVSTIWRASYNKIVSIKSDNIYTLKYEDFISRPADNLSKLCSWLNIEFKEDMLDVEKVGSSHNDDNKGGKGISNENSDVWRQGLTTEEIYIITSQLSTLMNTYGYDFTDVKPNRIKLFLLYALLPVKAGFAFVLNLSRTSDPIGSVLRRIGLK
jgi:omega-hydroxy-beta-dihydromenaquinone-9 sulfotransferase